MVPLLFVLLGFGALVAAAWTVRGYGSSLRLAQILAAAPETPLAEVEARAVSSHPRYIRVRGRISSAETFPDELDRPLVFRRRRVELQDGRAWRVLEDERLAVPFGVEERGTYVGVDVDLLGEGLVVLPRTSEGTAGEIPDHVPPGTAPESAVRLRIQQVSAVERAVVAGVPHRGRDGRSMLTAGSGRPLIVSTLEEDEAMRVLGGGNRRRAFAALSLAVVGMLLLVLAVIAALTGAFG